MLDNISIFLGILAWWVPIRAMLPWRRAGGFFYIIGSFAACALSIQLQLFQVMGQMYLDEAGVGEETFSFLYQACGIMMMGTFILVGISIYVKNKARKK